MIQQNEANPSHRIESSPNSSIRNDSSPANQGALARILRKIPSRWKRRDILKMALPVLMEQTFLMSLGVVNTIMASRIGEEAVSAIGMVDSIHFIFIAFFSALAVGGTVVVAQLTGQGKTREANNAIQQALFSGLVLSIAVTVVMWFIKHPLLQTIYSTAEPGVLNNAFLYFDITVGTYPLICLSTIAFGVLRGAGDTKTPMKINVAINAINLVLSYTLIYGIGSLFGMSQETAQASPLAFLLAGMGVRGAAIAISIARGLGAVGALFVLIRGTRQIRLTNLHRFRLNMSMQRSVFGVGIPASVESIMFNGGKLITQVFIVSLGTVSIASNYIAGSMNSLMLIPGNALAIVATTMVGQAMGRKDTEEAGFLMKYLTWTCCAVLVVMGVIAFPFAPLMAGLYSKEQGVIALATQLFRMSLVVSPLIWSWSFLLPAGLKGSGDVRFTMVSSIIGMWTFRIGTGWLFAIPLGLGVPGIWLGMYADWLVRGILFGLRLQGGRWKNMNVLKGELGDKPKMASIEI